MNTQVGRFLCLSFTMQGSSKSNSWETLRRCACNSPRIAIALGFTATFTMLGAAQDFMAPSGAPAEAFPKPERPVADIVSPIWHGEQERDAAGEPRQLVRLLGIKPGMTVADIGAGSGYYVVRLAPIVGPHGRIIAQDVVPEYLWVAISDCRTSPSASVSRTIRGCRLIRSTLQGLARHARAARRARAHRQTHLHVRSVHEEFLRFGRSRRRRLVRGGPLRGGRTWATARCAPPRSRPVAGPAAAFC
jgi:Protein-L-isoaspartate(D-aspartate) O-methyltransferase (PCMT)